MIVYGYAKESYYSGNSAYMVKVRVPSIHGPYKQSDAGGKTIRNYVKDSDLPVYPSVILPYEPKDGDIVVLANHNNSDTNTDFIVIGLTGASYETGIILST